VGDPLEQIYEAADRQLASLLEAAGPATTVIVFSVLGMGPNYSGKHLLPEILERLDGDRPDRRLLPRAVRRLAPALPTGIKRHARAPFARANQTWRDQEVAAGRFFAVDHDLTAGAVRINLAGREPRGRVEPGPDYSAVLRYLEEELRQLRDEDTGDPVVTDLVETDIAYRGPWSGSFADLLVLWRPDRPVTAVRSPRVGVVRSPTPQARSGNHRAGAWFVAAGPGICPTSWDEPAQVVDLTASVAAVAGVKLDMVDGQVIGGVSGSP
jgi:predicted AlkP superfamily phosphohydrolase/phosphomutase